MKTRNVVLALAAAGMLFMSCDDGKKKEAEMQAENEKMEMDANLKLEEEAKMVEMEKMEMRNSSIASKAMASENFSTLVTVLKAAGLAETFMEEGEYTVFAPTNTAFAAVPKKSMDMLLMTENVTTLQNLLKYHVVAGEWKAEAVIKAIADNDNKYTVTTLAGENIVLSVQDGKVMIKDANGNMATVTQADIDASNGVIHGIDKVIMPKG